MERLYRVQNLSYNVQYYQCLWINRPIVLVNKEFINTFIKTLMNSASLHSLEAIKNLLFQLEPGVFDESLLGKVSTWRFKNPRSLSRPLL